ncbi:MAG: NAD(P)H-hydrate dehydratase [Lysobacter sp.]|nr:MAG: NAD(P)H-hydrate dehydratase [Lysobacter sp.]
MRDDAALFDVDSVRRLETAARAVLGERVLMERAGQAAWRVLLDRWPAARCITVVAGPGGNGGDGYVLARLARQSGREVVIVPWREGALASDAAEQARAAYADIAGGACMPADPWAGADVVVDALFGIGFRGTVDGAAARLIKCINEGSAPVLSLDVPSGVGGSDDGPAVRAAVTLEFLLPKAALRTGRALDLTGDLELASLDVGATPDAGTAVARHLGPGVLPEWLPPRARDTHKGTFGRVLCIGGDTGMGGAILLTAEAALRAGAGLVHVHSRAAHRDALLARLPEAMPLPDDAIPDYRAAGVIAIGPGLGTGDWGRALFAAARSAGRPLVVDADALTLLADGLGGLPPDTVLTPHPGEAARLLGCANTDIQADRLGSAAALVERFGCVAVLKGAGTIVVGPGQLPVIIRAGNPGMATGGMGDVLTGVIAALRAQGLAAFDAACCGALLHASAGDLAARGGMRGLLPSDLMPCIRSVANPR